MKTIIAISIVIILLTFSYWCVTPSGRSQWNNWWHNVQKIDDATSYETRKQVEYTCRAMIASYESDKLVYEQYKDSNSEEKQSWAEQAKIRANKTAVEYNNYILKNNYVFDWNIPSDISSALEILN